jgi:DNA-binding MltR family transcriptional regulator
MPKRPPKPTDRPASPRRPRRSQPDQTSHVPSVAELMRRAPEGLAAYDAILSLLDAAPKQTTIDRGAAIVGVAFIEYALKSAITTHLRTDLTEEAADDMVADIFDDYDRAPLSSLSMKTRMAYGLGIIDGQTRNNFDTLRRIRNCFAHTALELDFTTQTVEKEIQKLTPPPHAPTSRAWGNMLLRNKFISAIHVYYWMLLNYQPAHAKPVSSQ